MDENAEADDDAEFLRRDGEDEVRMRVGQNALHGALSGTAPEPAAVGEGVHRRIDLERCRRNHLSMNRSMRSRT